MNKSKKNSGITLIALVVTIIVLIILAGISINLIIGDNGMITKAKEAKEAQTEAEVREKVTMILAEYAIEKEVEDITLLDFLQEKKNNEEIDEVTDNGDGTITVELDGYAIVININELSVISIDKSGKTTKINLSATTAKFNETITATVSFGEEIDYAKCKWMYSRDLKLGTDEESYTNTFTKVEDTINLVATEEGIYYLHILVIDNEGNKIEKLSRGVKVVKKYITAITLSKTAITLDEGQEETITATIEPIDPTIKDIEWISSDETIAIVNETGKITAIKEGNVTITAKAKDGSEINSICVVEVKKTIPTITGSNTSSGSHAAKTLDSSVYTWEVLNKLAKAISDNDDTITNDTEEVTIKIGSTSYTIGVGDKTTVKYSGTAKTVRIMGFNHDMLTSASAYGGTNTYAGISFEFTNIITSAAMNSSNKNSGGWNSCALRTTLNNTTINSLSNSSYIKQVKKSYIKTWNTPSSVTTCADKLWLLSCSEVWDNANSSTPVNVYGRAIAKEGEQYKYYKNIDPDANAENSSLVKGSTFWWFRSPSSNSSQGFCGASYKGVSGSASATASYEVAPGFCI